MANFESRPPGHASRAAVTGGPSRVAEISSSNDSNLSITQDPYGAAQLIRRLIKEQGAAYWRPYVVSFALMSVAAAATALLIAPSAYHRIQFREGDKELMLKISNALALAGLFFLASAVVCSMYVITDVVIGGTWTPVVTAVFAALFALLWYGLPLYRKARSRDAY